MTHSVWRFRLRILAEFLQYLIKRKFRSKKRDTLFPNAKGINLRVLMSPILGLWNRFWMPLGQEFIGKKARPSKDSAFLDPCLQEGWVDNL